MTENGGLKVALFRFIAVLRVVLVLTTASMLPLDLYPEASANIGGLVLFVVFSTLFIGIVSAACLKSQSEELGNELKLHMEKPEREQDDRWSCRNSNGFAGHVRPARVTS